jgi:hypothetical protein
MSMENSNDTTRNQSCDFPVFSAVPQPLRHRVPFDFQYNKHDGMSSTKQTKTFCKAFIWLNLQIIYWARTLRMINHFKTASPRTNTYRYTRDKPVVDLGCSSGARNLLLRRCRIWGLAVRIATQCCKRSRTPWTALPIPSLYTSAFLRSDQKVRRKTQLQVKFTSYHNSVFTIQID